MFEDWKVGQTGWVRLRNGKVARAIQFGHDSRPVQIQFMKGDELSWTWVENSGLGSETSAISHLPDCTGFDWEPKFKVGDWVRIISHERWCDDAKKDHPIGSYRKIATISFMSRELKLETASRWKFFMFDHFEPFVYRVGDWVQVVKSTVHTEKEHPIGSARQIRTIFDDTKLAFVNHEERFTYILDFDMVEPHQWKIGDWFVVDEASDEDWFVSPMYKLVGVPQCVDEIGKSGSVKANGWYWVKEHCRPCDPPKAEPEPRFQPFIEYVGIHDAI